MPGQRFEWFFNAFLSLGLGAMLTVLILMLGFYKIATSLVDALLLPGAFVAKSVYGGFHGSEPIILMLSTNCIAYGIVVFGIRWLKFKSASK